MCEAEFIESKGGDLYVPLNLVPMPIEELLGIFKKYPVEVESLSTFKLKTESK